MTDHRDDWGPLAPLDDSAYAQPQDAVRPKPPKKGGLLGRYGALGALAIALLSKTKFLLAGLKFLKFGSLISMFVTVGVYALFFGWPFAVAIVGLIFFHEMGHAIALKRQGIPAGAPVFIPFMGAFIAMKGRPRDAWVEAYVGIGGPLLGSLVALIALLGAYAIDSQLLFAVASVGFLLNLFNMLPLSPLDGGRIAGAVSRWFWALGLVMAVGMFFLTFHPILILVILMGVFTIWQNYRRPVPGYYDISVAQRVGMGVGYFALLGAMVVGMMAADAHLTHITSAQTAALAGVHVIGGLILDRARGSSEV